ncbi:Putative VIER F-box protein 1 [Ancistrocladus abbreviatus]
MGQSASTLARNRHDLNHRSKIKPPTAAVEVHPFDYTFNLPDECLACIFQSLGPSDRRSCSTVCRRWRKIEGQSHHRLSLNVQSDLLPLIPAIFARFDSVTKLSLKCDRRSASIGDEALILISLKCRNLTRLKLRSCREISNSGMEEFSKNCTTLKKLSLGSCNFGARGINAVLDNCAGLEELSVKRLRGLTDSSAAAEPIGPGVAASSLKVICLKELYNGQYFEPLIIGSKCLRTLKIFRCSGDWDRILLSMAQKKGSPLAEVHLERVQVSDVGLNALSNCEDLEILHLVKTPECTDAGLLTVAEKCKLLRKLHIDGCRANRIGDEGLIAVAKNCPNLQELVLIGVNPTHLSLAMLATNCKNLERLALCGSETVGDAEISCIAAKCIALRKLCIKNCPVSDHGIEALGCGCPNLVKVKVKKCRAVTSEGADWLRATRGSLAVNLDTGVSEHQDTSVTDEAQDGGGDAQVENGQMPVGNPLSNHPARSTSFRLRLNLFSGRNAVASTLRRWSSSNSRIN